MNYKMSFALLWIGLIAGLALFVAGFMADSRPLFWAGVAVVVLGIVQTRMFYCCPVCGGRFHSHGPLVKVCPHCGEKL